MILVFHRSTIFFSYMKEKPRLEHKEKKCAKIKSGKQYIFNDGPKTGCHLYLYMRF